ncbi:very short patch repair endonuclease [Streptomyces sp. CA-146814]|uniref:very short patch repair endonuclease n=1 Tax=Streptomyces sp. CA-146814 TaxID=3240053 RepID=UPI003D8AB538
MVAQRSRVTAPELALRRALHSLGFRYRVDLPIVGMPRRRAEVTFTKWRTAVFVQGCFWHACPTHRHAPRRNSEWYTDARLTLIGWLPLRIWEHETADGAVGRTSKGTA